MSTVAEHRPKHPGYRAYKASGVEWLGEADPDDVRELLNYRRAFDFVSEYLDSGAPVSEELIREIHKRLVEGVRGGQAAPGAYRKVPNYVVNAATGATSWRGSTACRTGRRRRIARTRRNDLLAGASGRIRHRQNGPAR